MGRLSTFWRLVREGERDQLRAVLNRALFPAFLFRRNAMLITRLREVRRLPRPLPRIGIRWGGREDEPALLRIRPREGGYAAHLDDPACRLLVGEVDGQLASFNWFRTDEWHASRTNGYSFLLGPGAVWAFGFEVDPSFRMSGIFHKHWAVGMELLREIGVDRVYGSVQADNPRSVNSHRRLGFEMIYHFSVLRVAGLTFHRAVPDEGTDLPASRGLGRWIGGDPPHGHPAPEADQAPVTR
jgi:hypothetical protein